MKTAYIIVGPTAVGKSAIAMQLARQLGTAVVSADSRQCYREMSVGTAKPTKEELAHVQHYFIDAFSITNSLDAADYETLALGYLKEIFATKDVAVVCGGTGLYIKALSEGLDTMPPVNDEIVQDVNNEYETRGLNWLQHAVQEEDPDFYREGEIKNPARLLRALIFKRSTGDSIINYRTGEKKQRDFNIIKIGLELPREVLYDRINQRVDDMMANGLLDEVRNLYPLRHLKNLQTVGYSELFDYIEGLYTLEEAVEKIKQNTRHYAKRQMTWFKKDKEMQWYRADEEGLVNTILNR
ncbi:tRNA (adenosine(37)-N6)-dimethylallyltransferase MiaA [Chitinophagaceae bacterium IBVUCB1]|nr:tRNA (adenosine(37)-N6)-dimethylallyltransferase MiaA [Chitinophagaceae bacterium IBVUCB1]